MRTYSVLEPHRLDPGIAVEIIFTENDILDLYWQYWKDKMEEVGREDLITESMCIEQWVVGNWAAEFDGVYREGVEYGVVMMDYDMWKEYDKRMKERV